jgi:hypothetical protein
MSKRPLDGRRGERGKVKAGWGCLLWLIGVPLPIVIIIMLIQNC